MSAQWVLSGLIGAGSAYAADITVTAGSTQIIFVTSWPDGASALTQAHAAAAANALRQAAVALPGGACTLTAITFNGMTLAQAPGVIPASLIYPAATWANYAATFTANSATAGGAAVGAQAGMIAKSPADGILSTPTLVSLTTSWAGVLAGLSTVVLSPVTPVLQVIAPASVIS